MDEQGWLPTAVEGVRKHIGKVLWSFAGLATLYIGWSVALGSVAMCEQCAGSVSLWLAAAIVALVVAGHFVNAFTRNLPPSKDSEQISRELRTIFVYVYVIQSLALGTGLLLLVGAVPWVPEGKLGGLAYGCQESETGYGSDLARCVDGKPVRQWLMHIGSRAEGKQDLPNALHRACDAEPQSEEISKAIAEFSGSVGQGVVSAVADACGEADPGRRIRIKDSLAANGVVSKNYKLRGGLIVPLYVVVLSVMGAAVGMSRRLPEIQRQAARSFQSSGKAISAIAAREKVVFQIMQVLAAPLIAVTAFAAFEPDTVTAAVLIGFTSGFTSEAVLMKLRQASEALTRERTQTR